MTSKESVLTRSDIKELIMTELENIIENDCVYLHERKRILFAETLARVTILAQKEIANYISTVNKGYITSEAWLSEKDFACRLTALQQKLDCYMIENVIYLFKRVGELAEEVSVLQGHARYYSNNVHGMFSMLGDHQTPKKISDLLKKLISIVEDEEFLRKSLSRYEFEKVGEWERMVGKLHFCADFFDAVMFKIDRRYKSRQESRQNPCGFLKTLNNISEILERIIYHFILEREEENDNK